MGYARYVAIDSVSCLPNQEERLRFLGFNRNYRNKRSWVNA